MTTLRQHIENLDVESWAALTKQAATAAVEAAQRCGQVPPPELVAVAAMSERELVEQRSRAGSAPRQLSPVMQLVDADHRRALAEQRAREADQGKQDAQAAAQMARVEADEAARAADDARERARVAKSEAAHKAAEHAAELRSAQKAFEDLRAELERVKSDTATEVAAAHEQVRAANERAEERAAERREERQAAQVAFEELRAELERVRADAIAEVAAAQEQARAADERAEQRLSERAQERGVAEHALEELRGELEQVRAQSAAELAAAQGRADGRVAAAESRARAEIDDTITRTSGEIEQVRTETAAQLAAAHEQIEQAVETLRSAQAEAAQARADAEQARAEAELARLVDPASSQLLSVPIPAAEVRAHSGPIEDTLARARDLDYALETALVDHGQDIDESAVVALAATVQRQAADLSEQLQALVTRYSNGWQAQAAQTYVGAATQAYGGLLARIGAAVHQLAQEAQIDPAVITAVTTMLDSHPWRR